MRVTGSKRISGTVGAVHPWFEKADLSSANAAERRVIDEVVRPLDQLQPERIRPGEQVIEVVRGETWVKLQHDSEPLLTIEIVVNEGWVHFYGAAGYDEAYGAEWASDVIDILADLLQATYTIETYERRGMTERMVSDISEPHPVRFSTRPLRPWRWRRTLVQTEQASFECGGHRP